MKLGIVGLPVLLTVPVEWMFLMKSSLELISST